jgi:hypothetical protein
VARSSKVQFTSLKQHPRDAGAAATPSTTLEFRFLNPKGQWVKGEITLADGAGDRGTEQASIVSGKPANVRFQYESFLRAANSYRKSNLEAQASPAPADGGEAAAPPASPLLDVLLVERGKGAW